MTAELWIYTMTNPRGLARTAALPLLTNYPLLIILYFNITVITTMALL